MATNLTKIPAGTPVRKLPYVGTGKRKTRFRPYGVFINDMGVLRRIGSSYTNVDKAMRRAAEVSNQYGTAVVMDGARAVNDRMVSLFKKGRNILSGD